MNLLKRKNVQLGYALLKKVSDTLEIIAEHKTPFKRDIANPSDEVLDGYNNNL